MRGRICRRLQGFFHETLQRGQRLQGLQGLQVYAVGVGVFSSSTREDL